MARESMQDLLHKVNKWPPFEKIPESKRQQALADFKSRLMGQR